jgi:hypothetical protein
MTEDNNSRRVAALMQLADFRMKRIVSRRDHEWKVTLGLWALLGAGIINPLEGRAPSFLCWVLVVVVVAHAIFWIRPHWVHSKEDAKIAFQYHDNARLILANGTADALGSRYKMRCWEQCIGFLREPICWAQFGTTALLAFGVWFVNRSPL